MVFDRFFGRDNHNSRWSQIADAAFDVKKLFSPQVTCKSGLGYDAVTKFQGHPGCHEGIATMRDIGERTTMNKSGRTVERLHQIGMNGVAKQDGHRSFGQQFSRGDGLLAVCVSDHDFRQPIAEIEVIP